MYKLENNVQWTDELKNAFKHNITRAKIIYDNTEINYDNGIKDITLEDNVYVPDLGFIGQAVAKKVTLTLLDNEQTTNLENKEFELYIGADYNGQTYYINYGNFIVNEPPENDSTNGTIKIIAYDYMIKFNKIYEDQVTYPVTLKNYLINICSQAGVTLGTQSFANDDFIVADNQFEGKQLREILKHIGKCAFSWARIGQDNKLYLDFENTEIEQYQVVDYIESTGTQYINTDIKLFNTSNHRIIIDFEPTEYYNYNTIWGSTTDADSFESWIYISGQLAARYNNIKYGTDNTISINTRHLLDLKKEGSTLSKTVDNISYGSNTVSTRIPDAKFLLFLSGSDYGKYKLYSCKLYQHNVLVSNLIPCIRKSDNKVGMYDLVRKVFLTNRGTGNFVAGNNVEGNIIFENITETFTIDEYKMDGYKKANEYYGPINKVTYGDSDIQGQEVSVPTVDPQNVKELIINDNYFGYTLEKRNELIQAGENLFGFTYMPVTQLDLTGAIYLDCTDVIAVEDENENTIVTRVFSHTIKYNGIIKDTISSEGLSDNQQTYENMNTPISTTNRTEVIVDRANKRIQNIVSEIGDRSQKTTTITQDIDTIESEIEDIEDLTKVVTGIKTITISDAYANEDILELHIYGNNTVFDYLYPADDLYPADNLYPYGDSRIRFQNDEEDIVLELGIDEVLRANSETRDEVFIDYLGNVSLIRRLNQDGTTKTTPTTTLLGQLHFKLIEGDNIFTIVNYTAPIEVKYVMQNDFTDIFATKAEMNSSITQTAQQIELNVSAKFDGEEIASRLNVSSKAIELDADKISFKGDTVVIDGSGITLADGAEIIGGSGVLTNLQFVGRTTHVSLSGNVTGQYDSLGFECDEVGSGTNTATVMVIAPYIPEDFTIVSANIVLKHYPIKYYNESTTGWGYARKLKLYEATGDGLYEDYDVYTGVILTEKNYTEIQGAFGNDGFTPSVPSTSQQFLDTATSIDISDYISTSNSKILAIKSSDTIEAYTGNTKTDFTNCAKKTGMVSAVLNVIGYLKR